MIVIIKNAGNNYDNAGSDIDNDNQHPQRFFRCNVNFLSETEINMVRKFPT